MLAAPHTLGLITTSRCTAACEHCCFGSSPAAAESIPTRNMHRYIEEGTELPTIKVVVFTGGECFLLGKELDDLVKRAARHRLVPRFVSNGYWATSRQAATRRLDRLQRNGLREANFSTGDQHARFVKPEYVFHGAVAAADLGITSVVVFEVSQNSRFPFEDFIGCPEFRRHLENGTITIKLSPWVQFEGRSKITYTDRYLAEISKNKPTAPGCTTVLRVLAVTPREDLIACCGLTSEEIKELHLGSLRQASIREIVARTPDDFIKMWIYLHGPEAVIRYAQRFDPSIRLPRQAAHICDTCRYLYGHPRIREVVLAHPPENIKDIVNAYKNTLMLPPPDVDATDIAEMARAGLSVKQLLKLHRIAVQPTRS